MSLGESEEQTSSTHPPSCSQPARISLHCGSLAYICSVERNLASAASFWGPTSVCSARKRGQQARRAEQRRLDHTHHHKERVRGIQSRDEGTKDDLGGDTQILRAVRGVSRRSLAPSRFELTWSTRERPCLL